MMDLVTERDDLLTEIVTNHVHSLLPGGDRLNDFARRVTVAALLGRLPNEGVAVPVVVERSIPAPISPEAVEPVISVPAIPEVPEVPVSPSGETQEEEEMQALSSPAPPVALSEPVAAFLSEEPRKPLPSDFDGKEAARRYIFECLMERKPVNAGMVGDLLENTLSSDIRKFISATQDEFNLLATGRETGNKHPQYQKEAISQNLSSLMAAVAAVGEDEGPEDDDLQEIEAEAVTLAAPTLKSATKGMQAQAKSDADRPRWWNDQAGRKCAVCSKIIVPRRYGDKQTFEAKSQYDLRKYCGNPCVGRPGGSKAFGGEK
jgi:hypothetical protein